MFGLKVIGFGETEPMYTNKVIGCSPATDRYIFQAIGKIQGSAGNGYLATGRVEEGGN